MDGHQSSTWAVTVAELSIRNLKLLESYFKDLANYRQGLVPV